MLHLAARTEPSWGERAIEAMDEVLLDHAHCEKKAASTAMSLIFRYPDLASLMVPLSRLAREELSHFELVIEHLRRRGLEFCRQRPSPYAAALMTVVRREEPLRLLDTLLCCALIEARSCERMQLLAEALQRRDAPGDPPLHDLYRGLLACEARHHHSYLDLARCLEVLDAEALRRRLEVIAEHEAVVIAQAPTLPRMHAAAPSRTGAPQSCGDP
jgi:tRNA-(ms[2]io[6]A)-hydroxylase